MGVGIQVWISRLYIPCVCVCFISSISSAGGQPDAIPFGSIVFFFVRIFFFFRTKTKLEMSDQMTRSILLSSRKPLSFFCCCFRLCVFVRQQIVNTEIEKSALCVCVYTFRACVCVVFISPVEEKGKDPGKLHSCVIPVRQLFLAISFRFFPSHLWGRKKRS